QALCIITLIQPNLFAGDVTIEVSIIPRASYFFSELNDILVEKTALTEIGSISIGNDGDRDLELKLRVQVYTTLLGDEPIADYTTDPTMFPIEVPQGGTYSISNINISEEMVRAGSSRLSESEMEDRLIDAYGEDAAIKNAGLLPEDTYRYEIYVFEVDQSDENLGEAKAVAKESFYLPLEYGVIDLIYPEDHDIIPMSSQQPQFLWSPLNVRAGLTVRYFIKIWKADTDDIANIMDQPTIAEGNDLTETSFVYPGNVPLIPNQRYFWHVEAKDETGNKIGVYSTSIVNTFQFGEIFPPSISELESEFSQSPVQLIWESHDPNASFRLIIAKDTEMNDVVVDKAGLSGTVMTFADNSLFEPGRIYYWRVSLETEGEMDGITSEVGQFRVIEKIDLVYPLADEVSPESLNFIWTGDANKAYRLKVSESPDFAAPKVFDVGGNSFILNRDTYRLKLGQTYYWKVVVLNTEGEEWGESEEVGQFSVLTPEGPALLSHLDENFMNPNQNFIVKLAEWADSHTLYFYDREGGRPIVEESIERNIMSIDFLSDARFEPNKVYYWKVSAFADAGNLRIDSERGRFIYTRQSDITITAYPQYLDEEPGVIKWSSIGGRGIKYTVVFSSDVEFSSSSKENVGRRKEIDVSKLELTEDTFLYIEAHNKEGSLIGKSELIKIQEGDDLSKIDYIKPRGDISEDREWSFQWIASDLENATLLISTSTDFSSAQPFVIPKDANTMKPDYAFKLNQPYYWVIQEDGETIEEGERVPFKIVPAKLSLIFPKSNQTVKTLELQLLWTGSRDTSFKVMIDTAKTFNENPIEIVSKELSAKVTLEKNNTYFWKVQVLDEEQSVINESETAEFIVETLTQNVEDISLEDLSLMIKKHLDVNSILRNTNWQLESIETADGEAISSEELDYLIKNSKESIQRIVE
ncbi:hypothetical protein DID78_05840, partial [Candidatus Marinamargulisbacteria bacterium SCGC AG-343-D04]